MSSEHLTSEKEEQLVDEMGNLLSCTANASSNGNDKEPSLDNNGEEIGKGDSIDAGGFFGFGRSKAPEGGRLNTTPDCVDYAMMKSKRGKCLIINNKTFDTRTRCSIRNGTEIDGNALKGCFKNLNFDVEVLFDATAHEIKSRICQLSKEDHTEHDCLVVCVLTHGDKGNLYGRDSRYPVDELYLNFTGDKCPTLAGKPKLFFIQACQGSEFDKGVLVRSKGEDVADVATYYKIPTWADFLIVYSTVAGYYSWRHPERGSWFVQALTSVLKKHSHSLDLISMLTIVNQQVAYNFESSVGDDKSEYHGNKQVPCITSMLTRRVWFNSKV